jgi:acetyl esterase
MDPAAPTPLSPDLARFVAATEAFTPPGAIALSLADQRRTYDRMAAAFHRGRPVGLAVADQPLAGVPCRIYGAGEVTVLYLHGGGFVVGGLDSHDDICAEIAAATGLRVISADYRLCPEHPHPAAFDDALAVAQAIPGPLLLAGDSAGGTLAAAVARRLRGEARLLGQVLIYPGLGGPRDRGSFVRHAHAPMLTAEDVVWYARLRHGGAEPTPPDPDATPLAAPDFTGLPPTLAIAAEIDPLADDAVLYAAAIRAAGGQAVAVTEPGLVHGYLRARGTVAAAARSFARVPRALAALARGAGLPPDIADGGLP